MSSGLNSATIETSWSNQPRDAREVLSEGTTRRVLLAWQEPLGRLILEYKLRSVGLDVEVASSEDFSSERIRRADPDAVLIELGWQRLERMEVVKEVRLDPDFGNRPIYICTACSSLTTWERRATNTGPTKLFNTVSTPVDAIIAELTADLMGISAAPEVSELPCVDEIEEEALQEIPHKLKERVVELCSALQFLADLHDPHTRSAYCCKLRVKVHSLVSCAALAGRRRLARKAAALELFLKAVCDDPASFTDHSLLTVNSIVEVLARLCRRTGVDEEILSSETAVVVSTERTSRAGISDALLQAGFKTASFGDPAHAIERLGSKPADVVVIDLHALEVDGSDLCAKIRELPLHEKTPVMIVSEPDRYDAAKLPSMDAVEMMARPFIFLEVALKSLNLVQKNRAGRQLAAPAGPASSFDEHALEELRQALTAQSMKMDSLDASENAAVSESDTAILRKIIADEGSVCAVDLPATAEVTGSAPAATEDAPCTTTASGSETAECSAARTGLADESVSEVCAANGSARVAVSVETPETLTIALQAGANTSSAPTAPQSSDLQQRLRDSMAALTKATAELEMERGERHRVEQRAAALREQLQQTLASDKLNEERIASLEQQLREREEALTRASNDLQKAIADREVAAEQWRANVDLGAQFRQSLASFDSAKAAFERTQEELDGRLQATLRALQEIQGRLQNELAARLRLEQALEASQRECEAQRHHSETELSRLNSALHFEQLERKRVEGEALQLRFAALDSTQTARTTANSFRHQMRSSVDNLLQATRRLLELQMQDDQRTAAQSVLEHALLLQMSLQPSDVAVA
jgi:DNA-binding response OmpR family regulator